MTHQEAVQLLATLRDLFPAGECSEAVVAGYAELMRPYQLERVTAALNEVVHERQSRAFPAWGVIEAAIDKQAQPAGDWRDPRPVTCGYCQGSGWVELAGTVKQLGVVYERGVTACRWCPAGQRVYERVTVDRTVKRRHVAAVNVESAYDAKDAHHHDQAARLITLHEYLASDDGRLDAALENPEVRRVLGVES